MDDRRYNIIFKGEISQGLQPDRVKRNLAALFKTDIQKIEPLFSGTRSVLKKNLDQAAALKYKKALEKAGAVCALETIPDRSNPAPVAGSEPETVVCPKCTHQQAYTERCAYCGTRIKGGDEPEKPPPLPKARRDIPLQKEEKNLEAARADQMPDSFFGRLCYAEGDEGVAARQIIMWSLFAGAVSGFFWGGLYDPWQNPPFKVGGFYAALLNTVLFGLWALVEVLSILGAKNFGLIKRRTGFMFVAFLAGGTYVAFISGLETMTVPSCAASSPTYLVFFLIAAFLAGGVISAIASITLTIAVSDDGSLDTAIIAVLVVILIGFAGYKLYSPGSEDVLWKYRLESMVEELKVWNQYLIAADSQGGIHAIKRETGERAWRLDDLKYIQEHIHIERGTLFMAVGSDPSLKSYFIAVDLSSGDELWRTELNMYPASAGFTDGKAAVRGSLGGLAVIDLATRDEVTLEMSWSQYGKAVPPLISGEIVFCMGHQGELIATDMNTGRTLWVFETESTRFHADPAAGGVSVYLPAGKELISINKAEGVENWRFTTDSYILTQTIGPERLYLGTQKFVYAVDLATGDQVWKYGEGYPMNEIVIVNGVVFVTGSDLNEKLYALDMKTGFEKQVYPLEFSPGDPVISGAAAYMEGHPSFGDTYIYAIDVGNVFD